MKSLHWLSIIMAVHVMLGLLYLWATPPFEASDEGAHYAVVHWLAQGNPLPIQAPDRQGPDIKWDQEGSQPPLYYWLAAALTAGVDTSDFDRVLVRNPFSRLGIPGTTHNVNLYRYDPSQPLWSKTYLAVALIRSFSLLLSVVTVILSYLVARQTMAQERLALLAAALVAFTPMALFINASVNNDNLLMLLSTAAVLLILRLSQSTAAPSWRGLAILGMVLGLAALTKVSGLVVWPLAALALLWSDYNRHPGRMNLRRLLLQAIVVYGVALSVSGGWFVRNWLLYGELLGTRTMVAIAGPRTINLSLWEIVTREWQSFYLSYWGIFGVFSIRPPEAVVLYFYLVFFGAGFGILWAMWRRRWPWTFDFALHALFVLATFAGVLNWTMQTMASQGRLMFGAIASISTFMAAGWLLPLPERWQRAVGFATAVSLACVAAVIPAVSITPRYAAPHLVTDAQLPGNVQPIHAVIAESMELVGYTSDDAPIQPGEEQQVTLYWRALQPMTKDNVITLAILGQGNEPLGIVDTWPGGGLAPTSYWTPGMMFADPYALPISAHARTPTLLRLEFSVWESDLANRLPIRTPDGSVASVIYLPVGRVVPEDPPAVAPQHSDGSTFETGITLLGWDAAADEGALTLTLYWKTDHPVLNDYTVFVHVLDSQGVQVTQADSPPLNGDWPTSAWVPGQAFAETRRIALPPDLPPKCCSVRLGFYAPPDGARLLAFRADGAPWPDNAVILKDVVAP